MRRHELPPQAADKVLSAAFSSGFLSEEIFWWNTQKELNKYQINSSDKVLLASLNSNGSLLFDIKIKGSNLEKVLE